MPFFPPYPGDIALTSNIGPWGEIARIIAPIDSWRPIIGVVRIGAQGGRKSFNRPNIDIATTN